MHMYSYNNHQLALIEGINNYWYVFSSEELWKFWDIWLTFILLFFYMATMHVTLSSSNMKIVI